MSWLCEHGFHRWFCRIDLPSRPGKYPVSRHFRIWQCDRCGKEKESDTTPDAS